MQQNPTPESRPSEFKAVEGGTEIASGGLLLVEAYAAIWFVLMWFVWVSWRRQLRLDARIAELEQTLASRSRG